MEANHPQAGLADWDIFKRLTDINTKNIFSSKQGVDKNASLFSTAIIAAAKQVISRGRRRDYKRYWNSDLDNMHKLFCEARERMERNPTDQCVARSKKTLRQTDRYTHTHTHTDT